MILGYGVYTPHKYTKAFASKVMWHMSFRACINTWRQESTLEWIDPCRTIDLPMYVPTYLRVYPREYVNTGNQ